MAVKCLIVTADDFGAAPEVNAAVQAEALLAPEVIEACRSTRMRLGGFGDFVDRALAFEPLARIGATCRLEH
jgi:hypothetical protein